MAEVILILAPLLVVRLGLWHLQHQQVAQINCLRHGNGAIIYWASSLLLAISLCLTQGSLAGLLAIPWLLVTLLLAWLGLKHGLRCARRSPADFCFAISMIFLSIGGGWALLSRLGVRPLGFSDTIVLLTAIHFHYAGFALPLMAGLAYRSRTQHPALPWIVLLIVLGVPLVAVGITASPVIEVVGSCMLASGAVLLACLQIGHAHQRLVEPARGLLLVSGMSLILGMVLAVVYAVGEYVGTRLLDIPVMIPLHGAANSIGFSLAGLYGWRVACREG